jgi:hypothetical protein
LPKRKRKRKKISFSFGVVCSYKPTNISKENQLFFSLSFPERKKVSSLGSSGVQPPLRATIPVWRLYSEGARRRTVVS